MRLALDNGMKLTKHGRKPLKCDAVHFWTFDAEGRIARYRHDHDTAAELAAWRIVARG